MKPHNGALSAREKIQDVLNVLSSKEVPLGPNNRYTQAEMIAWCESWIKIYETGFPRPKADVCSHLHHPQAGRRQHSKSVFPFDSKSLGRFQQTKLRAQLTDLVGCLDVSSGKIYPLLLVSHATEIEIAPNTSPVEVGGQGFSFGGNLDKARIQAVARKCFQELQERCFLLEQQPVRTKRRLTRNVVPVSTDRIRS